MKNELRNVTEEWMKLERMTLKQRKVAELFYDERLMKLIEKEFIKKNKSKLIEPVEYLIMSVGTSYEPLVLSIKLFKPKRILFLYTEITEAILNNETYIIPLMFTMYTNAMLREEQEKYDMATLLLYRLLEMIEQRRLALHGLYVSKADYTKYRFRAPEQLKLNELTQHDRKEWLKDAVYQIKIKLFPRTESKYLPEQISLLEGFIILLALQDEICLSPNGRHIDKLKRIRSMVFLRNNSIFAHGLGPVPKEDYLKFKSFVQTLFQEFCVIEKIDFTSYLEAIHWLNPVESEYYSKLEV